MTGGMPGPAPEERPQPTGRRGENGVRVDASTESGSERRRAVFSAEVEHQPGVLADVSSLFSRRQFNIESLSVGPTATPGRARMTVVVEESPSGVEQARKQLAKLVPVASVEELDADAVERELALVTVDGDDPAEVAAVADAYGGEPVDVSADAVTVELTGPEPTIDAAIAAFQRFGVKRVARSGTAAVPHESSTTEQ